MVDPSLQRWQVADDHLYDLVESFARRSAGLPVVHVDVELLGVRDADERITILGIERGLRVDGWVTTDFARLKVLVGVAAQVGLAEPPPRGVESEADSP